MRTKLVSIILIIFILFIPYNNFPYIDAGTLKPLTIFPATLYIIYIILITIKRKKIVFNNFDLVLALLFIFYFLITIINTLMNYDYLVNNKAINPLERNIQFLFFLFISFTSYLIGKKSIEVFGIRRTLSYFLIAFLPSLLFGVAEILSNNHNNLNFIRSFFTSTIYPANYYRVYMLTTEPSWAAFDLSAFIIPVTFYFYKTSSNKRFTFLLLILVEFIILLFTKSLLGMILIVIFLLVNIFMFLKDERVKKFKSQILTSLSLGTVLLFYLFIFGENNILLSRFTDFINNTDISASTRTISYETAFKIFLDNPLSGIGFRNFGYYYSDYLDPAYNNINLVADWADKYSVRFADVKSTIIEIIVSSGLIGAIITFFVIVIIIKKLSMVKKKDISLYILLITVFIISLAGSFSISLIGYPAFWFFLGLLIKSSSMNDSLRSNEINKDKQDN